MADTKITSVTEIKVGQFIKMVDRDSNGKFSYTGEVTVVDVGTTETNRGETIRRGSFFRMSTQEGVMSFIMNSPKDHELFITMTKPMGWAKFKKNPESFKRAQNEANKPPVPIKTKKQQVIELVNANPRKKEAALLKLAKKEIGGSEAQLTNYIKLAKK